jgi:hypothetical protein
VHRTAGGHDLTKDQPPVNGNGRINDALGRDLERSDIILTIHQAKRCDRDYEWNTFNVS